MMSLKRAGFVASSRGREGGYHLARPASTITLLEVITALEGPLREMAILRLAGQSHVAVMLLTQRN